MRNLRIQAPGASLEHQEQCIQVETVLHVLKFPSVLSLVLAFTFGNPLFISHRTEKQEQSPRHRAPEAWPLFGPKICISFRQAPSTVRSNVLFFVYSI